MNICTRLAINVVVHSKDAKTQRFAAIAGVATLVVVSPPYLFNRACRTIISAGALGTWAKGCRPCCCTDARWRTLPCGVVVQGALTFCVIAYDQGVGASLDVMMSRHYNVEMGKLPAEVREEVAEDLEAK